MSLNQGQTDVKPMTLKNVPAGEYKIDEKLNAEILAYCLPRLQSDNTSRLARIRRYARTDRRISGYQKLSLEDTQRQQRENETGAPQAIAAVLPITDMHIEDTAAFFTEIFAPASGNFYSNQGDVAQVGQVLALTTMLENDYKMDGYYDGVAGVMRSLLKYNVGGFELEWRTPGDNDVGADKMGGNCSTPIPLYNFMYDQSVDDVKNLRKEGEWYATIWNCSRFWLLEGAKAGRLVNVDKVLAERNQNNYAGFDATFYKDAPTSMGLNGAGDDDGTVAGEGTGVVDWSAFDAGLSDERHTRIMGFEVVEMKIRIVPSQFDLEDDTDDIVIYRVTIVDSKWVVRFEPLEDAIELPIYIAFLRADEMRQAQKSYAESTHAFQRHISFMANIAIATERGNTYGLKAVDPLMFEPTDFKSGETAGIIVSKMPGRDVRSGILPLNTATDTAPQYAAIGNLLNLMKEMFPSQGLPSQVAGIDRAVTSQVAAVMIGAVRRLHMLVRRLDASLMNPARVASYRNYVSFHSDASQFQSLTEKDVARLLNSGLGQLNREVAATAIERLLFTLIQNPNSAAQFDLPGLFRIWSQMLNTGQDLGKLIAQTGQAGQQGAVEPAANPQDQQAPVQQGA